MKKRFETIDEYIQTFPPEIQGILQKIRQTIRQTIFKTASEVTETISYQIPTFKLNGKLLISFAAWKNHIAVYPIPSGSESFQKKLSPYIKGKGTIQFPLDKAVPFDLVEKIVMFRLKDVLN